MGRERLPCSPRFAPQPAHGEWSLHTGLYWAWAATALSEETASQGSDLSDLAIRGILAIGVIVFVTGISACDCGVSDKKPSHLCTESLWATHLRFL
jgi:hypothetical protein